jgi:hypothetical protein
MGKYTQFISLLLILMVFMSACDEQRRVIEPFVPTGNRVVLLEEFTGKGCTNCPKGSREIDNLLLQFPNNLVAVSIHAGFFANPQFFPLGLFDFRTDEGEYLFNYLGPNLGYPAGVINRIPVAGEMQLSLNQWASAITIEIQKTLTADLSIAAHFDQATREVVVEVEGIGRELVNGDIRLSVMLTESGIVDAQDDFEAGGIVDNYVHNHVLRDMLTPAAGETLSQGLMPGQPFHRMYRYTLPAEWNADRMEVIAFLSQVNGSEFPVLQAASAHVNE